ncbi:trichohyalin-like isoform X4 [Parambassis ranga]|uniref:Trichohyalin-like isoform X4 n=1 Tax=Parambassis ranga TaxID=210632 RepID=A0A6P7KM16_9TELE|nr:trichohyalin-like isoform X4 [Parambassis ranga]
MISDHDRREHKWKDVACQWESPEDDRREVGCQSDLAETADAGVQVELWAQQATRGHSGGCVMLWKCVSVGEDKPEGGNLEEHSCKHRTHMGHICLPTMPVCPPLESKVLLHTHSMPSVPQFEPCISSAAGGRHSSPTPLTSPAVSGTPPGLIAPISPPLAEEEENEEEERKLKFDCSDHQQPRRRSTIANKRTSQDSRTRRRRRPNDNTHKTTKLINEVEDKESQREEKLQSCGKTQGGQEEEEEGRKEEKDPGEQMEADMLLKQGRVKTVQKKGVEQVGRPQRTKVGPPIRYLLESEEQSHGLLLANHRENMANLKKKLGKLTKEHQKEERRTEDRLQQLRQVCHQTFTSPAFQQLRLSIRGTAKSCQSHSKKFCYTQSLRRHYCCHRHANREGHPAAVQCSKEVTAQQKEHRNAEKPLLGESFKAPDWSRQIKHVPKIPHWLGKYQSSKRRPDTARRKRRCQENDGGKECNRKSSEEKEAKRVCLEEEGDQRSGDGGDQVEWGKEVKKHPQRLKRKMVGPPIRYLIESEVLSCSPLTNQDIHIQSLKSNSETVDGASEMIDRLPATKRQTGHMITEEEEELPQRPRRKMVGPPIRYLLESEDPSHGPLTPNTSNHDGVYKHKPSIIQRDTDAVGGTSEMIDRLQATKRQTGHMITEEEEELPQRPRRKMVGPPIRYLLESEEPSHGPLTLNRTNHKPNVRQSNSKTLGGASEMIDRLQATKRQTGHINTEEGGEKVTQEEGGEELPQRPRRKMVGPPIGYLLESEDPSHGPLTPNRTNHDGVHKPGIIQRDTDAVDEASEMIDRLQATKRQTGHMITEDEAEKVTQEVVVKELSQRPRRKMVGPPIRYLLESEEPSHGPLTPNRPNDKPNVRQSNSKTVGGASEMIDRLQAAGRQTGHMITEEGGEKVTQEEGGEELPQRKMVGPPIRYLLESEDPSHGPLTPNTTNHDGVYKHKPSIIQRDTDAVGGTSEMIDRLQAAGRQTGHMITEEGEELPQRPRRKMVGPPIRYLLESEDPSHGPLTPNTTNHDGVHNHKPSIIQSDTDAVGGTSEMIDRLQAAGRQTGHMITEEGEELPQRPRRKMVGPPIRYLLESEEPSHGPLTLNRTNHDGVHNHKPSIIQSDTDADAVGGHRRIYLVYRDQRCGQVTIISPCCVRLQRLV